MADELEMCAAAFFRCMGKNQVTEAELVMGMSLSLRWMPAEDARVLLGAILARGLAERSGQYIKSSPRLAEADVPPAYRPPEGLASRLRQAAPVAAPPVTVAPPVATGPVATPPVTAAPAPAPQGDVLSEMIASAPEKSVFVAECNRIKKRLGVSMSAAAYIALREAGAGDGLSGRVREAQREIISS